MAPQPVALHAELGSNTSRTSRLGPGIRALNYIELLLTRVPCRDRRGLLLGHGACRPRLPGVGPVPLLRQLQRTVRCRELLLPRGCRSRAAFRCVKRGDAPPVCVPPSSPEAGVPLQKACSVQKESEPSRTIPSGVARVSSGAGASKLPVTCYHARAAAPRYAPSRAPRSSACTSASAGVPFDWVV